MSVVVVAESFLCEDCIHLGLPLESAEGIGMLKLVECNDLCSDCAQNDDVHVRYPEYKSERELIQRVIDSSPWCRRERWRARWRRVKWWFLHKWERFDRWKNWGWKVFPDRSAYTRCTYCGFNYLPEDLDACSGDTDICMSCDKRFAQRNLP